MNVEPVDLSLPSFHRSTGSTLTTYKTQYRNEGRDTSTGSTLTTCKTQYRNAGRDRSTGSTLITHKTQYRNEGRDRSTGFPHFYIVFYV
jgi:hypothetical protein